MKAITSPSQNKSETVTACYHCGDTCLSETIIFQKHSFCCNGCKTVYQILSENDLDDFYSIEKQAGTKIKEDSNVEYLELPSIRNQLIQFKEGSTSWISFSVPAIHCSSCIYLLENLPKIEPFVLSSTVNFSEKKVHIAFNEDELSLKNLVQLLHRIGYQPEINFDQTNAVKPSNPLQKKLLYQIGIAGFCFGNIMLLSVPEYVSGEIVLTAEFQRLFSYWIIVLSLPVFFYAGQDYLIAAWKSLRNKHLSIDVPIAVGMIALLSRSLYEILVLNQAGYLDSLAGLIFFLLIGKWFQAKTYSFLSFERDYKSFFPLSVQKVIGDKNQAIAIQDLAIGDVMEIRNQEVIPADGTLLSADAFIDYSFVTGESLPLRKQQDDFIYAGGRVQNGSAFIRVEKPVNQSYLTQLWNNPIFKSTKEIAFSGLINRLAQRFTIAVFTIAVLSGLYWYLMEGAGVAAQIFTSVLIVACPCALALAEPFTYGHAMRIFGRNGFYLKNTQTIGRLNECAHLVFDKTGTLTRSDVSDISFEGKPLYPSNLSVIYSICRQSIHPLSQIIAAYLNPQQKVALTNYEELSGKGLRASCNSQTYLLGSAKFLNEMGVELTGLPISDSKTAVYLAIDGVYIGCYTISNVYRNGLSDDVEKLAKLYALSIISGDSDAEKEHLEKMFPKETDIRFNMTPEAKLEYVQELEKSTHVMMLGDGLNDAGALQQSHVGIAVSEDVNQFSPGCDAILSAQHLGRFSEFLGFARHAQSILKLSLLFSLLYNTIGLAFAISGLLSPLIAAVLMPLSSLSVVAFATGMTQFTSKKYHLS